MQTIIQLNSKVNNNILYFNDYNSSEKIQHNIHNSWENDKLVIFDNVNLPIDYDFLNRVNDLDGTKIPHAVKKLKNKALNQPELLKHFYKQKSDQDKLKEMILKCNDYILNIVKNLTSYEIVDVAYTWRLSTTIFENLHYDIYPDDPGCFTLRLFFNIDTCPRLWATTHSLKYLCNLYKNQIDFTQIKNKNSTEITRYLNKHILSSDTEKHFVLFAPEAMWIGNSIRLSHQIIYGRKLIAYSIKCKEASLKDQSTTNKNYISSLSLA